MCASSISSNVTALPACASRPPKNDPIAPAPRMAIFKMGSSKRIVAWACLQRYPTQFGELGDTRLAAEASESAFLDAAEWHVRLVMHGRPVDVADARFDLACDIQRASTVATE